MSGTYPASPGFNAVGFIARDYNVRSASPAGIDHVRGLGGQRWEWSVSYHPMTRQEFGPVAAFIVAQGGSRSTFQITLPEISFQLGDASGTARVNNAAGYAVGSDQISVDGFSGSLLASGYVKFGHSKVYMVEADRSGPGTLSIQPPLIAPVSDNEIITYDAVPFTARLDTDAPEWEIDMGDDIGFEIAMVEAL